MPNHTFIMDLAKLMIVAAWADGELTNDEINALKDLLFTIGEISGDDWSVLEMYMESPPSAAEREALIARTLEHVRIPSDKAFIIDMLERLFHADGEFTPDEAALLDQLRGDLDSVGLFKGFANAFKSALSVRSAHVQGSALREDSYHDYLHNTIYYDLKRREKTTGKPLEHDEATLRKACLAVGLLSHVAHVDATISDTEQDAITRILQTDLNLGPNEAALLTDISRDRATRGLDYHRLACNYFEITSRDDRISFVKTLFRVANALDNTSFDEHEEIRRISISLKVEHKDFINAKLAVKEER